MQYFFHFSAIFSIFYQKITSLNLKNKIESFYKNNIDWNEVRKIGELDYSQNVIRDFKKYSEKQKEAV